MKLTQRVRRVYLILKATAHCVVKNPRSGLCSGAGPFWEGPMKGPDLSQVRRAVQQYARRRGLNQGYPVVSSRGPANARHDYVIHGATRTLWRGEQLRLRLRMVAGMVADTAKGYNDE